MLDTMTRGGAENILHDLRAILEDAARCGRLHLSERAQAARIDIDDVIRLVRELEGKERRP
jgi:hypothetical protein